MQSKHPSPQTLRERAPSQRNGSGPAQAQRNQPMLTPFVAEALSVDLPGEATCAANAPHPAGLPDQLPAATPCRNTTAEQVTPAKNLRDGDRRRDSGPPPKSASRRGHMLQISSAKRDQSLLHRLFVEPDHSAPEHS